MNEPFEIALAFPRGAHQEMFIDGVLRYAREKDCNWTYITTPELLAFSILDLRGWQGDGAIAALNTSAEASTAAELFLPVVNISSTLAQSPVPRVNVNNLMIGQLAADHLLERGFQSFAYYGLKDVAYSQLRKAGFDKRLAKEGLSSSALLSTATFALRGTRWQKQHHTLSKWIEELPTPVAIFAVTDYRARQILEVCRQIGRKVPQDVAVLGVDNEEVICQHVDPPLSSVARNNLMEGYRAAAVLDQMLQGREVQPEELIAPLGVVQRKSTEVMAVSDLRVREALDFINQNLRDPFDVNRVAHHVGVSRRWLEYAFRAEIGESPYKYILRQRLDRARRLLEHEPKTKIRQIAEQTGFSSAKQLTMTFCQNFGMSPSDYRKSLPNDSPLVS